MLRAGAVAALLLLLSAPALSNGPHVQLYFFTPPGLKQVPAGAYWEANFTGAAGQEIVVSVVRTKGTFDLLYMNESQWSLYSAGSPDPASAVRLNASRVDLNFRVAAPGTYHLVIDNTRRPEGGAPGDVPAEAYVLFATTTPPGGSTAPPDPFLSVAMSAVGLSVLLGLAAFAAVAFNKLPAAEAKRGLFAGTLAAPLYGGFHAGLTWALLLPFQGPGGGLASAMGLLGLLEGLYALPFGLAFPGARRVLAGGPVRQGLVAAAVAWGVFVFIPWLLSPAATSGLDVALLLDEAASLALLGAATGWLWSRLEKGSPAQETGGNA